MSRSVLKRLAAFLAVALFVQPALLAAPIPSKSSKESDLVSRSVDLMLARARLGIDSTAAALAREGLDPAQVQSRMSALTTADLLALARNPAQIRAAGVTMSRKMWTAVAIGAGAVVVGGLALAQKDDGEDDDDSDDGED